jgi:hypothetical protein
MAACRSLIEKFEQEPPNFAHCVWCRACQLQRQWLGTVLRFGVKVVVLISISKITTQKYDF